MHFCLSGGFKYSALFSGVFVHFICYTKRAVSSVAFVFIGVLINIFHISVIVIKDL